MRVIWLDDMRDPSTRIWSRLIEDFLGRGPDEVVWVQTADEFKKECFKGGTPQAIFFDNDLGEVAEGCDCFRWVERKVRQENLPRITLYAQTANTAAKYRLQLGFQALRRFWDEQEACDCDPDGMYHCRGLGTC